MNEPLRHTQRIETRHLAGQPRANGQYHIGLGGSPARGAMTVIPYAQGQPMVLGEHALAFRGRGYRSAQGFGQGDELA